MGDIAGDVPAAIEKVTSKHITGCVSASLSKDGSSAGIVFTVAGLDGAQDDKLLLTLPAHQADWLRTLGHHLALEKVKRDGAEGGKVFQPSLNPSGQEDVNCAMSDHPMLKGKIVFTFNPFLAEEMNYQITWLTALKMAAMINRMCLPKISAEERKILREFELTVKPKLIIPG